MALAVYLALIGLATLFALVDWRRAWLFVIICGVVQDPVRKLTPGSPVWISFLVIILYGAIIIGARRELLADGRDFARRFPTISTSLMMVFITLCVAAMNGIVTYGVALWKVPLLSLITYCVPLLAAAFGYTWLRREEGMYAYLRIYAWVTAIALIGTFLEYLRVESPIFGLVAYQGDYIRHLPGIQIRLLSGIYRSPDVMAWHAAMLTSIAIAFALRHGFGRAMLLWSGVAAWGFFNCMVAGRRKAIYFVVVFVAVFLWRSLKRVRAAQALAVVSLLLLLALVVRQLAQDDETSIYARGALTTQSEIAQRLQGGIFETFSQFGLMGAGLGTATQGVYHLLGNRAIVGWQEGGLGKLAVELGLPGILALLVLGWFMIRLLLRLTAIADVPGSSHFLRALLFALTVANATGFIVSAQAYTDAVLALMTGFLGGCLFATATLDERAARSAESEAEEAPVVSPAPGALPAAP
jgi:hypothetical protein